ncbi:MAG: hypothetical protein AAB427_10110 [Chloroflexota bacterium]
MNKSEREEIKSIVREVVQEALAPIEARLAQTVTRDELQTAIAPLVTRDEMLAAFDRYAELNQQQFHLISQQIQHISQQIQRVSQRLDSLEARVAKLEERLGDVEQRLGNVEDQMENFSRRLQAMNDSLAPLVEDRKQTQAYVLTLDERIVAERAESQSEHEKLLARVNELESRIAELESRQNG